jgi:glycosyltransferase involved in cell wall biosynthesis
VRLGVFADLVYRRDGDVLSTDRAFVLLVTGLAPLLGEVVLFGRLHPEPGRAAYMLPTEGVRLVALPHYPRVTHLTKVGRAFGGARKAFAGALDEVDALWIFGPNPLSLVFIREARRRGKPVVLGIRQDFPEYLRNRLPELRWRWAQPLAHGFEGVFRRLAKRLPAVVVGDELGRRYGGGAPVLATGFSLVRARDLVTPEEALARDWNGPRTLLSVGRLDPEKNPLLLVDIVAGLTARGGDWLLRIVGVGSLADAVAARARDLGVADRIELAGYVANGPDLWREYRGAHGFLHVSFTEGLPQVLFEAQAAGLPIVATDVGGVADALDGGRLGLLVPPADAGAAVDALERLAGDEELRRTFVERGLERAGTETMDAQLERIAAFLRAAV